MVDWKKEQIRKLDEWYNSVKESHPDSSAELEQIYEERIQEIEKRYREELGRRYNGNEQDQSGGENQEKERPQDDKPDYGEGSENDRPQNDGTDDGENPEDNTTENDETDDGENPEDNRTEPEGPADQGGSDDSNLTPLQNSFLNMHNKYRQQLANGEVPNQPRAKSMPNLVYDSKLESEAQAWANECNAEHKKGQGENLAYWTTSQPLTQDELVSTAGEAVTDWFDEYKGYNYNSGSCNGVCTHYTNVIWANTNKVGCASAQCPNGVENFSSDRGIMVVCHYDPVGNWIGEKPYPT